MLVLKKFTFAISSPDEFLVTPSFVVSATMCHCTVLAAESRLNIFSLGI